MDYSNESWIKVYTRDTASWRATSLAARGLALELSRNMGRFSNEISLGARGLRAVGALVGAPWPELEPLLKELIDDGRLVYDEERQVLVDPEHLARQQSATSPAQRKRDERERAAKGVAKGPLVTAGHAPSRRVTPSHDQREEIDPTERDARARTEVAVAQGRDETPPDAEPEPEPAAAPSLDAPLPAELRTLGAAVIQRLGVVDVDLEVSWRNHVDWLHDQQRSISAGSWERWVRDDCARATRQRKLEHDREWRGPKRVLGRGNLFVLRDAPPAPCHEIFVPPAEPAPEARISPSDAREALVRAGLA